ncbi:MAG: hypothetical protein SFW09_20165 [Hyphomicrobiaceae bacterium]|nr:hypothetical protein [Hyphomicrobiaceae bacterium]
MARGKPSAKAEFVLFDVIYEDGSQSSNKKVPAEVVGGFDGDAPAKAFLEAIEREIVERSGRPRPAIKEVVRARRK